MMKLELVSLIVLCVLPFVATGVAAPWARAIATAASTDFAAMSGSWGAPEAVAWFEDLAIHSEGKELYALSLIQAGKPDEAEGILKDLTRSAEAQNNLGVALSRMSRDEEAGAAFEAALKLDPKLPEANYNLGREASGVRAERAREYLPGRKLLAMPTLATWGRAMVKGREGQERVRSLAMFIAIAYFVSWWRLVPGLWVFVSIAAIASLVLVFRRRMERRADPYGAHWWLSVAVPGAHERYAPLGVVALAAYVYCGFVLSAHARVPGAVSIIEAIFTPSTIGAFGVGSSLQSGWRAALIAVSAVMVYAIPLLSAAGVLALRLFKPEALRGERPGFTWQTVRAALFLAGGVPMAVLFQEAVLRIPGVILILCGVASFALAIQEKRRAARRA